MREQEGPEGGGEFGEEEGEVWRGGEGGEGQGVHFGEEAED